MSVDANAAEPVYKQLTPQEAYAFYGESMQAVYYSQSGYKSVTLHPSANRYSYYLSGTITGQNVPSWLNNTDLRYVVYSAAVSDYSMNPSYLGLDVAPNVHFEDCTALRFAACGYLGGNHVASASYDASFINIYAGGQLRYENGLYTDSNGYYPEIHLTRGGGNWTNNIVWADYQSDTISDVSLLRVGLNGVRTDGGYLDVYLLCPLVNQSAVTGTGVVTGTTDTTAPPSSSDVDLTETNGLIGRVIQAVQNLAASILDGLKGLFIPDDDFMDEFKDDMQTLLEVHLGGLYEAEQIMVDSFEQLPNVVAKSEIYIPPVTLNLAGTPFALGDWHVPLKVSGMPAVLYEGIAFIIDFLCLAAFLRMCRNKLEIFLNPDSEVIKE